MRKPNRHAFPSSIGRDELERKRIADAAASMAFFASEWVRQNADKYIDAYSGPKGPDNLADALIDAMSEAE